MILSPKVIQIWPVLRAGISSVAGCKRSHTAFVRTARDEHWNMGKEKELTRIEIKAPNIIQEFTINLTPENNKFRSRHSDRMAITAYRARAMNGHACPLPGYFGS